MVSALSYFLITMFNVEVMKFSGAGLLYLFFALIALSNFISGFFMPFRLLLFFPVETGSTGFWAAQIISLFFVLLFSLLAVIKFEIIK